MNFFVALLFSFSFIYLLKDYLKRSKNLVYLITIIFSIFFCFSSRLNINLIFFNYIENQFTSATLATAFFTIVMFIGVLKQNTMFRKVLLPIRTQISFIASFLLIPHFWTLISICFTDFITFKINYYFISASISFIIIILFFLLFFTSFKYLKIKLKAKKWKKIQNLSYLFFFLIFIHIVLVKIPYIKLGYYSAIIDLSIYSIIFYLYFLLKFNKWNHEKLKQNKNTVLIIEILITLFFILTPTIVSLTNIKTSIAETQTTTIDTVDVINSEDIITDNTNLGEENETAQEFNLNSSKSKSTALMVDIIDEFTPSLSDKDINDANIIEDSTLTDNNSTKVEEAIEITPIIEEPIKIYKDGIYSGNGEGYRSDIILKVTLRNDKITNIKIKYSADDDRHFDKAFDTLKKEILNIQSSDVDTICCATHSSKGIIQAVEEALDQARIK